MRIGVFGGSFDPIHLGHLILAEQCREQARLDEVWFVPAALSPLKSSAPRATERQREEMIRLAIAGHDAFRFDGSELNRGGTSYTVETLREFSKSNPNHTWHLLLGNDSLANFANWREPAEICRLALPLVYFRPGTDVGLDLLRSLVSAERWLEIQSAAVQSRLIEISSTDIRARCASRRSIRYLVPRAVEMYIQTQKLYCSPLGNHGDD